MGARGMASQSKRGRLRRSATRRSPTDVSPDCPEVTDSKRNILRHAPTLPRAQATRHSGGARDRADLARTATGGHATLSDEQPTPDRAQPAADNAGAEGGNFRHALLDQAELASANLSRASFNHANLAGADLTEANLRGASLPRRSTKSRACLGASWLLGQLSLGATGDRDIVKAVADRS